MLQSDPSSPQLQGARCAEHVDRPASVICTRCGSYACELCRNEGPDGLEYCNRCSSTVSTVLAEPGIRLAAHVVDRLVVFSPMFVTGFIGVVVALVSKSKDVMPVILTFTILGLLGSLGMIGYQLYLMTRTGQSIGKRMMRIKVVRTDGSPADIGRVILLRNVVPEAIGFFIGIFAIIDALFIFFNAERRTLHDQLADTKVIKVNEHAG
ncbi:RDD family protein [Vitiosangium sp. GDMCC 1.1324]|uniref:RDD family protein n=1 Tax=Vitiosangium sp. (strain GDMCC 1.1324) TaxID=2138576 RepID=UPI000D38A7C9|nr:RDD family protein [Vitiosangium sp. GDMCC 1.1324]PTL79168.1 RDD family protein [Vitiosangium sp. GDMCC 1.1324]